MQKTQMPGSIIEMTPKGRRVPRARLLTQGVLVRAENAAVEESRCWGMRGAVCVVPIRPRKHTTSPQETASKRRTKGSTLAMSSWTTRVKRQDKVLGVRLRGRNTRRVRSGVVRRLARCSARRRASITK